MQRTLSEVTPQSETLDELLITLPSCRHTFTVETLDGHTGMSDFYLRREKDQQWHGLRAPAGFQKPPTCPTCRAPITAPRYGRIIKRADLDILERNVAAQMSQSLGRVQAGVQNLSEESMKTSLARAAGSIIIHPPKNQPSRAKMTKKKKSRDIALKTTRDVHVPMSEGDLKAANTALHYIDSNVAQIWSKETQELFNAYKAVVAVAESRSAHMRAWEAAFSFLYEREIKASVNDPARMPRRPQENAMRVAKIQVGQPRPLADRRFLVEAFWSTLHIRLTLIRLAQTWLEEVSKREASYPAFHRQQWATYIDFLFCTCTRDVSQASEVAEASESHRQLMKTILFQMRVALEHFRFRLFMCKQNGTIKDTRTEMSEASARHGYDTVQQMDYTIKTHFLRKVNGSGDEEAKWVEDNFSSAARTIVDEWAEIERSIRLDTFYQPVSLEEKMQIVGALDFGGYFVAYFDSSADADKYVSSYWALFQLSKWTHVRDH